MFSKRTTLAVSAGLTVAVCSTALAGNPFRGLTTTEGGYHTWDSDLINVDAVSQTGHGVYVAVLDTGMVPNGRLLSEARALPHLGTGFDSLFVPDSKKTRAASRSGGNAAKTWGPTGSTHGSTSRARSSVQYRSIPTRPRFRCTDPVRGIAPDVTASREGAVGYQVPSCRSARRGTAGAAKACRTSRWWLQALLSTDLKRAGPAEGSKSWAGRSSKRGKGTQSLRDRDEDRRRSGRTRR